MLSTPAEQSTSPPGHRGVGVAGGVGGAVGVRVVHPGRLENGWGRRDDGGALSDGLLGKRFLHEVYREARADYTGRVTVPVLWDREAGTIVCNESREILRMLATVVRPLLTH